MKKYVIMDEVDKTRQASSKAKQNKQAIYMKRNIQTIEFEQM